MKTDIKTDIKLFGKWEDDNDTFFTGKSSISRVQDIEETFYIGVPIEEFLDFRDLLNIGEVTISFIPDEDCVAEAEDFYNTVD